VWVPGSADRVGIVTRPPTHAPNECALREHVHPASEDAREFIAEMNQVEQRVPRRGPHQEVDIACIGVFTASHRSEHRERWPSVPLPSDPDRVTVLPHEVQ
jgi:hypothetical protein